MTAAAKLPRTSAPSFADAGRFFAAGYAVCAVRIGDDRPVGLWLNYRWQEGDELRFPDHGVALNLTPRPHGALSIDEAASRYLGAMSVETHSRELAEAIDRIVTKGLGVSPARTNSSDAGTVRPFRVSEPLRPMATRGYRLAKDRHKDWNYVPHRVRLLGRGDVVVATGFDSAGVPYEWRDGSLPETPRAALPMLSPAAAEELFFEIENLLDARAELWM